MELQSRYAEITRQGLGLVAISYDSPDTLKKFSDTRGITFPLISDPGSATIRRLGLLIQTADPKSRTYGVPQDASGAERLPWSSAVERLTAARNYWVCTTHADGRPHAVPVWGVWHDGAVWFGTSPESAKGRNLARDPRAVVHLESGDDVVILEGDVEVCRDADVLAPVFDAYEQKYDHRPGAPAFLFLRPRVAQTWTEQDFTKNATRWTFA